MPNTPHDLKFRSLNLATFHVLHTMLFTLSISVSYNTAFLSNYALSMTTSIYIVNICITLLIFYGPSPVSHQSKKNTHHTPMPQFPRTVFVF